MGQQRVDRSGDEHEMRDASWRDGVNEAMPMNKEEDSVICRRQCGALRL
jgi:hypothetical protein